MLSVRLSRATSPSQAGADHQANEPDEETTDAEREFALPRHWAGKQEKDRAGDDTNYRPDNGPPETHATCRIYATFVRAASRTFSDRAMMITMSATIGGKIDQ